MASTDVHAIVRTLGRTIAIASGCVVQAVEAPAELAQMPRRSGTIDGVMTLGRRVVPVVNLARWLEPQAHGDDPARGLVLLLKDADACIGLAIDAVVGAQRIRSDQLRRLFHDDSPDELFESAALLDGDSVPTSILEPRRLMALARVWVSEAAVDHQDASDEDVTAPAHAARAGDTVAHATFRIADMHIALPAANVGELLRRPPLRDELPAHDGVQGLCEWRGRLVPVVDLAGALHTTRTGEDAAWVCIVREGELAIGIVMDEVLAIAKIAPDAGTPEHAPAGDRSVVARRLVSDDCTLQLVDIAALLRRYPETAISAEGGKADRLQMRADPSAPAYMVFDAGGMYAARIDGVQEVVPLPGELRQRVLAGIPTTLQWRQQPVPVLPIADRLVAMPVQAARQLIVMQQDGRLAALPIAGVKAMVPRGIARSNRMRLAGRPAEVVSVETEDHRASYPVVDLGAALVDSR